MNCRSHLEDCFYGSATVGEKGQVVIPAEARAELGIKPGDKILIMRHPVMDGIVMTKFESVRGFLDDFSRRIDSISEDEENNS